MLGGLAGGAWLGYTARVMSRSRIVLGSLVGLLSASCGGSGGGSGVDGVWIHAEVLNPGSTYVLVQADPIADTCVIVQLADVDPELGSDLYSDIEVRGLPHAVTRILARSGASGCSIDAPNMQEFEIAGGRGTISFEDLVTVDGRQEACAVDVMVDGDDGYLRASNLPIWADHCERPGGRELVAQAPKAGVSDFGPVTITAWNAQEQLCVSIGLGEIDEPELGSGAELPPYWAASFGRLVQVAEEDCTPALFEQGVPDGDVAVGSLEGTILFPTMGTTASGREVPCTVSVDVSLLTTESFAWVPNVVSVRGDAVVAGCQ